MNEEISNQERNTTKTVQSKEYNMSAHAGQLACFFFKKKKKRWVLSHLENVGSFISKLMLFQSKNC